MAEYTSETASSLPYHEPGIITILAQTSFLLLLNVINVALDRVLYCGLLGQVLVGIAWGTPGAKWLTVGVEETFVQLGYLGLILLVYEGMSFPSLSGCSNRQATLPVLLSQEQPCSTEEISNTSQVA
jgi:hypothetical protein